MSISLVQKKQCYIASSGSLNSAQTAGNLIVITVQGYSYNGTPSSLTCTTNNSDTPVKIEAVTESSFGAGLVLWYIWNCGSGTVTYTVAGLPDDCSLTIYEYSGVDASADPLIDSFSIINDTSNPLGASLTTEAGGLIFWTWGNEVSLSYTSMNSGATEITYDTARYTADAQNLSTSAGSTSVTANVSSDSYNMIVAASFRAAGGGGGTSNISGSASMSLSGSANIKATARISGTGAISLTPSANIKATARITGSSSLSLSPSATIRAYSSTTASSSFSINGAGTLTGSAPGNITGTASISISASGTIRAMARLTGSSSMALQSSGNVRADARITGAANITTTAAAIIRANANITGAATFQLIGNGTITNATYIATLKKWNGSAWVPCRITRYYGVDISNYALKAYVDGDWGKIKQAD